MSPAIWIPPSSDRDSHAQDETDHQFAGDDHDIDQHAAGIRQRDEPLAGHDEHGQGERDQGADRRRGLRQPMTGVAISKPLIRVRHQA